MLKSLAMFRAVVLLAAFPLGLAAFLTSADAHAMLERAQPGVGSTVDSPSTIELDFSEGVVPSFSGISLEDDTGRAVSLGRPANGSGQASLVVSVPGVLRPGSYKVRWHAVSVDTHRTQGSFGFAVRH